MVLYKHGNRSAKFLASSGYQKLIFKTYNGCQIYTITIVAVITVMSSDDGCSWCRLGHYTIPEEMDDVCNWLRASLELTGSATQS